MKAQELKAQYGIEPNTGKDISFAFQRFINESTDRELILEAGEYLITHPLIISHTEDKIKSFLSIKGSGAKFQINCKTLFDMQATHDIKNYGEQCLTLQDLEFTGDKAIVINTHSRVRCSNCYFHDLYGVAYIDGGGWYGFKNCIIENVMVGFEVQNKTQFMVFKHIKANGGRIFLKLTGDYASVNTGFTILRSTFTNFNDSVFDINQNGGDTFYLGKNIFSNCEIGCKLYNSYFPKISDNSFIDCNMGLFLRASIDGTMISGNNFINNKTGMRLEGCAATGIGDNRFIHNSQDVDICSCRELIFNHNQFGINSIRYSGSNGPMQIMRNSFERNLPFLYSLCNVFENIQGTPTQRKIEQDIKSPIIEGEIIEGAGIGITIITDQHFKQDKLRLRNVSMFNCTIDVNELEIYDCTFRSSTEVTGPQIKVHKQIKIDGLYYQIHEKCQEDDVFELTNCSGTIENVLCVGTKGQFISMNGCSNILCEDIVTATERKDVSLQNCHNIEFNFGGLDAVTQTKFLIVDSDNIEIHNMFLAGANRIIINQNSSNISIHDCSATIIDHSFEGEVQANRIWISRVNNLYSGAIEAEAMWGYFAGICYGNMIGGYTYGGGNMCIYGDQMTWVGEDDKWYYYHKDERRPCSVTARNGSGWRDGDKIIIPNLNWFADLILVSKEPYSGKVKIKVERPACDYGPNENEYHGAVVGWSDTPTPTITHRTTSKMELKGEGYLTIGGVAFGTSGCEIEFWIEEEE